MATAYSRQNARAWYNPGATGSPTGPAWVERLRIDQLGCPYLCKAHRWAGYHCHGQFTVRKGTVFEDSPIPLHIWFQAAHLMCSNKKGTAAISFTACWA